MRPHNRDFKIPGRQTESNFSHVVYIAHSCSVQLRPPLIKDVKVPVLCSLYNFLYKCYYFFNSVTSLGGPLCYFFI